MIIFGKVKEITTDFVKALIYGKSDARTAPQSLPHGIDSKPVNGDISVYCQTDNNSKSVILGYVKRSDKTNAGETRIYATDSEGVEVFSIKLDNNGYCTFDGVGFDDNLVAYAKLATEFNELKGKVNSLVTSYNSHIHTTTATVGATAVLGVISQTTSQATQSSANISNSKIDKIKTT